MDQYPEAYAHFLPECLFDHNPSLCYRRHDREHRKPPFRYYNMWSLDPGFKEVVQSVWNNSVAGTLMYQLVSKLKLLKNPLKVLNRNRFSDVEKVIGIAHLLLEELQIKMHDNPTDLEILVAEREAADNYRHLCKVQHSFLSQKAKVEWINIEGIEDAFLENYKDLLGSSHDTIDINDCIFSIPSAKSPGPDGYSIYKGIAKVLCNILRKVLLDIISFSQGAFVKGRNIVENVLICQDLVRLYNRKSPSPKCLIKIDLRKAYDSVEWKFLEQMLHALKFPKKFIRLIMACVTSPAYSLVVNGILFGFFQVASGLTLNKEKSKIYFNGMTASAMANIMQVSGFHRGALPFKYFGVPISSKKLTKNEELKLTDRIVARIRGLGARHLSYAGRLTLVQSEEGGFGIKDLKNWNVAFLGKTVTKMQKKYMGACYLALYYYVWRTRNEARLKGMVRRPEGVVKHILNDISHRFHRINARKFKARDLEWIHKISA
ncbi:uncharacterized protein LOC141608034 [Silene latifolia]|uniref:uncharacterized protein LOC141608034 n=1 Tax=Silene latifolia TaxID=37657 RepID=UPI003D7783DC